LLEKADATTQQYGGTKYAVMALTYATLAQSLPNEVTVQDARPFREVVQ
jgi:hypothetical protein